MSARTLNHVIDDLGVGWCQVRLLLFAGGALNFVGGWLSFLVSILPLLIAKELALSTYQRAALGSVIYVGLLIGNAVSADRFGRRYPVLVALLGKITFAVLSSFCFEFWTIFLCWLLVGVFSGIGTPAWNSLVAETSPRSWRFCFATLAMLMFSVAAIHAAFSIYWYAGDFANLGERWRTLILWVGAVSMVLLALAIVPGFVESPHILMVKGWYNDARKNLEAMRSQNSRPDISLEFDHIVTEAPPQLSFFQAFHFLFGRHFRLVTCTLCLSTFFLNFMYYGSTYSLPIVLSSVDLGVSPMLSLALVRVSELMGYFLGLTLERWTGRRHLMVLYLSGCLVATVVFVCGVSTLRTDANSALGRGLIQTGMNGTSFFSSLGWIVVYVYLGEAYPTMFRSTAGGFCMAVGRVGSFAAPWVFEWLYVAFSTHLWFFVLIGIMAAVNVLSILLVLEETKGADLEDMAPISSSEHAKAGKFEGVP